MPANDGNDAQVRVVAQQLFDAWKAQQDLEAKATRRWWQSNAGSWAGLLVIVVGAVITASNIHNLAADANARSIRNEQAINEMRAENADRLARIETKVDRLLEDRK